MNVLHYIYKGKTLVHRLTIASFVKSAAIKKNKILMKSVITPEKAAFIRQHYLKLSGKKIAKALGVSP